MSSREVARRAGSLPISQMRADVRLSVDNELKQHRMRVAVSQARATAQVAMAWQDVMDSAPNNSTVRWLYDRAMKDV